MDLNPYEPPREVNDQPSPPLHPEIRQIYYSLAAAALSGLYLLWALQKFPRDEALPLYEVLLFTSAIGGVIVGPVFCLLALLRWLTTK